MRMKSIAAVATLTIGLCGAMMAQDGPPPGAPPQGEAHEGRGTGFHGVAGQITAIDGTTVTLQTFSGGTAKVKITPSTRLVKDRNEAKLTDYKVGDRVFASGEQDKEGVWVAQVLGERTGAGGFPHGGAMGGAQFKPEDNGKTYIAGELVKVDGTKLTVKKPDDTVQVIEVDDDTSFRNERRESVTLADFKAGDFLRGQGAVKDGVFVAKSLNAGRGRGPRAGTPPPPPPPSAATPPDPPQAPDSGSDRK